MNIEYKKNVLFIYAPSILIGEVIDNFESKIIPLILCINIEKVIISFKKVKLIDMKGVDSIIKLSNAVNRNKGLLILCDINSHIKTILNKTDVFDYCYSSNNYKSSLEVFKCELAG